MVKAYIAKYGGTASDINADVAEAIRWARCWPLRSPRTRA